MLMYFNTFRLLREPSPDSDPGAERELSVARYVFQGSLGARSTVSSDNSGRGAQQSFEDAFVQR